MHSSSSLSTMSVIDMLSRRSVSIGQVLGRVAAKAVGKSGISIVAQPGVEFVESRVVPLPFVAYADIRVVVAADEALEVLVHLRPGKAVGWGVGSVIHRPPEIEYRPMSGRDRWLSVRWASNVTSSGTPLNVMPLGEVPRRHSAA